MPSVSACNDSSRRARPRGARPSRTILALALSLSTLAALSVGGCAHGATGRAPPSSLLEIQTETADADVWVDGEYIGQVQAVSGRLKLAPGTHRVEVRKPGHFPVQRTVTVDKKGGGAVSIEAELLGDPR